MDTVEIGNEINYPNKPRIEQKQEDATKSMFNIILFLIISYFYFDKNITLVLTVTIILLIHELGHLFAMRIYGYNDVKIFFVPFLGAYTTGSKNEISQRQNIIICLAGPIVSIIIAVGLFYYGAHFQNQLVYHAAYYMFFINLFNLLPIKPLDGGKVVSILFANSKTESQVVFNIFSIIAMIIVSMYLKSYILLIIPFLVALSQFRQYKVDKIKRQLISNGIDLNKSFNDLSDSEYWTIRTEVIKSFSFSPKINPDVLKISEHENKITKIVKQITCEVKQKIDLNKGFRNITILVLILGFVIPIHYIQVMKDNDPRKKANQTMYEQYSYDDIKKMKQTLISGLGNKISYDKKVQFADCYFDKVLQLKTSEYKRIFSLPKEQQMDSIKPIIIDCLKIINDSIK